MEHSTAATQGVVNYNVCFVCYSKPSLSGEPCSRRCAWLCSGLCPQCGRYRQQHSLFCGGSCANESTHANWCPCCGVRQLMHGVNHCGAPACRSWMSAYTPRPVTTSSAQHRGAGRQRNFVPHASLPADDKVALSLKHLLPAGTRMLSVVKVGGCAEQRKRYTAYRNRVEEELNEWCGRGAPKYGHGGEGNEHRRFVALQADCGAQCGSTRHCGSPACTACDVLTHGLRIPAAAASRTAISTFQSAADALDACSARRVQALLVCRVVVGLPASTADSVERCHSTARSSVHGDIVDVTMEAAVDAQFLILTTSE